MALAQQLLAEWDEGRGKSKSQLEIQTWNDATSHGRHFDRFIRSVLGVSTSRPSKQSDRISALERQVRGLGHQPVGSEAKQWEILVQHARQSCLAALRVWNDPGAIFRAGAFSLLFVTAWNSLAIALLLRAGKEWRKVDKGGSPKLVGGSEQSQDIGVLMRLAFPNEEHRGLRENVRLWADLRNATAHRHLPSLDVLTIPYAQAGLLNIEGILADEFGPEFGLADALSVPLQLSGFRNPGVLGSRRKLQASLPLDVQTVLDRVEDESPELLADESFILRVAFVPAVPASGRNPDAVAYFVKPGDVPDELEEVLERYVVLPKIAMGGRPNLSATRVMEEVERRTGFRFHSQHHAEAGRKLGARPPKGEDDATINLIYAEYITSFKRYLYSQAWIDRLVEELRTEGDFLRVTGWHAKAALSS